MCADKSGTHPAAFSPVRLYLCICLANGTGRHWMLCWKSRWEIMLKTKWSESSGFQGKTPIQPSSDSSKQWSNCSASKPVVSHCYSNHVGPPAAPSIHKQPASPLQLETLCPPSQNEPVSIYVIGQFFYFHGRCSRCHPKKKKKCCKILRCPRCMASIQNTLWLNKMDWKVPFHLQLWEARYLGNNMSQRTACLMFASLQ